MEGMSLISDFAIMLVTAGIVTVLFKKLKMPLILGYILAGFIISPYFPLFVNISNKASISAISEVGVVIILFHIGLEFDLHKMANIGSTAIVTALIKMSGVMVVGYLFGHLIGLGTMSCIFLGAMLSISSTVVIKKCFEDMKLQNEKYTQLVMGTLIIEDVLSIFIMLVLSTISVSKNVNGGELVTTLALMACYLVVWLLLGIFILPTLMNKVREHMTDEVLTVLSLGICFLMAFIAHKLGFSAEIGAFLAGSLFAGTVHAHDVERVTRGVKDMFAAIFFLSVGMLVDPQIIIKYWKIIIPIAIIAVVAKLVFATLGNILSGQSLSNSVKAGISLAPIGEFSFIIASLGISLGVMDDYLYPVIVAASIITILITPFSIRRSDSVTGFLYRHIPDRLRRKMDRYSSEARMEEDKVQDWALMIKNFFMKFLIYGAVMLVAMLAGIRLLAPALSEILPDTAAKLISCGVVYVVVVILLRPFLDFYNETFTRLWLARRANRPPLVVLTVLKLAFIAFIAYMPIFYLFGTRNWIYLIIVLAAILFVGRSGFIASSYLQIETQFLRNLNERIIDEEEREHGRKRWLDEDYNLISFYVPKGAPYAGKRLIDLNWGRNQSIYAVKVRRGDRQILLPPGEFGLAEGDKVYAIGERQALEGFRTVVPMDGEARIRSLKEFMESGYDDPETALSVLAIKVRGPEPYCNKSIRNTRILDKGHCMILGILKDGLIVKMPDANMLVRKGDIIWVMGSNNNVGRLAALSIED